MNIKRLLVAVLILGLAVCAVALGFLVLDKCPKVIGAIGALIIIGFFVYRAYDLLEDIIP